MKVYASVLGVAILLALAAPVFADDIMKVEDIETSLAMHRFAWLPLAQTDVSNEWVSLLWRTWLRRFGRPTEPPERLRVVLGHAVAFGVGVAQLELRGGVALQCGAPVPLSCCAFVRIHAVTGVIHVAKVELRPRVILFSGHPVPLEG